MKTAVRLLTCVSARCVSTSTSGRIRPSLAGALRHGGVFDAPILGCTLTSAHLIGTITISSSSAALEEIHS